MRMKRMSVMDLFNTKTGETEQYEIEDATARQALENKVEQSTFDELTETVRGKADNSDLQTLDRVLKNTNEEVSQKAKQTDFNDFKSEVTQFMNADKTSGIHVNGTKLVINV